MILQNNDNDSKNGPGRIVFGKIEISQCGS